jgi:hypothetical protein
MTKVDPNLLTELATNVGGKAFRVVDGLRGEDDLEPHSGQMIARTPSEGKKGPPLHEAEKAHAAVWTSLTALRALAGEVQGTGRLSGSTLGTATLAQVLTGGQERVAILAEAYSLAAR